jgi:hypothetical protein
MSPPRRAAVRRNRRYAARFVDARSLRGAEAQKMLPAPVPRAPRAGAVGVGVRGRHRTIMSRAPLWERRISVGTRRSSVTSPRGCAQQTRTWSASGGSRGGVPYFTPPLDERRIARVADAGAAAEADGRVARLGELEQIVVARVPSDIEVGPQTAPTPSLLASPTAYGPMCQRRENTRIPAATFSP